MVFRRDNKSGDAFQRQISALREQLGNEADENVGTDELDAPAGDAAQSGYGTPGGGSSGLGDAITRGAGYEEYGVYEENIGGESVTGNVAPVAPDLPAVPAVDAQTTVIAHDTVWKGEISSEGTVHIHGRFEGTLRVKHDIYVADEADVDATVNADKVVVAGLVKGTIRCGSRFEVLPTGRVTGDVHSPALVIHEGATVSGQVRMGPGESATGEQPTIGVVRRATRGTA